MDKRISGPFENEYAQLQWQREVLKEEFQRKEEPHKKVFYGWIRRFGDFL